MQDLIKQSAPRLTPDRGANGNSTIKNVSSQAVLFHQLESPLSYHQLNFLNN